MNEHFVTPDVTEDEISRLVHHFYGLVRDDPRLGPIFASKINDWDSHLSTMCDFWSSVMLTTGKFKGRPMPKHIALTDRVEPEDFGIWLALFQKAATDVCAAGTAAMFIEKAERIAESLKLGMFGFPEPPVARVQESA